MATLRDKLVVITGAANGLGRETAIQLALEGCELVLSARLRPELETTTRACRAAGAVASAVEADLTQASQVTTLVETALQRRGRIDIWIHHAGVSLVAPASAASAELHQRAIESQLFSPILVARTLVPIFRKQRHGVFIDVSSISNQAARRSRSSVGCAVEAGACACGQNSEEATPSFVISKFGLHGLAESMRLELARPGECAGRAVFGRTHPVLQRFRTRDFAEPPRLFALPSLRPERVAAVIVQMAKRSKLPRLGSLRTGSQRAFGRARAKLERWFPHVSQGMRRFAARKRRRSAPVGARAKLRTRRDATR